jgi:hypothetical protein
MHPNKPFTHAGLMLPAALLAWAPALSAGEQHRIEPTIIRIVNAGEDVLEISKPKAMQRLSTWKRHPKGFGAPAAGQGKGYSGPQKWFLAPDGTAEIVLSDSSPFYWLEFSSGTRKVLCTFDNYLGCPRLVGEPGVAQLTPVGHEYHFSFAEPPLDLGAVKAATAEYLKVIGKPESHRLDDLAARTNPSPHQAAPETFGRQRLQGYAGSSAFKPMESIREKPARPADSAEAPSAESLAQNQTMLDFYTQMF